MKKIKIYIASLLLSVFAVSCSVDDVKPQGTLDEETAFSSPEKLVTAAYAKLGDDWYSYPFNLWPYGDMSADDCLKGGSGENDTGYHPMEIFSTLQPDRGEFDELWYQLYSAISRCNRALESMQNVEETQQIIQLKAEARFLRAHFYYKLQQMWYEVPFIIEGMDNAAIEATPQSSHDELMQLIIDDFQYAYENLAEAEPGKTGRAHKVAAAAYLAKVYLNWAYGDGYEATTGYSHVDQAKIKKVLEYTEVVKNSSYDYLDTYGKIFLQDYANSCESIFAVQHSGKADDGTLFGRANWSNMLNGVWGVWSCGWDFHKPSQNLVNAFKTKNGLPMDNFDEDHNAILTLGADTKYKYDPRLFHTVGMPTYPYKYEEQFTLTKANSRTPNTYGYYCSMKEVPQRSKGETYDNPWQAFAQNDYVPRLSLRAATITVRLWRLSTPSATVPRRISAVTPSSSMPRISVRSATMATSPLRTTHARHCAGSVVWSSPWRDTASSTCAAGACSLRLSMPTSLLRRTTSTTDRHTVSTIKMLSSLRARTNTSPSHLTR